MRHAQHLTVRPPRARRGFTLLEMLVVIGIIVLLASLVLAVSGSVARASEERATRNTLEILNAATEEYERALDRRVSYQSTATTLAGGNFVADPTTTGFRYEVVASPGTPPAGCGVTAWTTLVMPYGSTPPNGLPAYSSAPFKRTASFLWLLSNAPATASILQKLPESVFRGIRPATGAVVPTNLKHAIDSWDTPIIAVFPGRTANSNGVTTDPPANVDKDGTVKCDSEWGGATTAGGLGVSCKDRRILWVSAGNDARFLDAPVGNQYKPSADNLYSYEP